MNYKKKIDEIRKHNSMLIKKLSDIELELEFNKEEKSKGYQKAKKLIAELEFLIHEHNEILKETCALRDNYKNLIKELMLFRNKMNKLRKEMKN